MSQTKAYIHGGIMQHTVNVESTYQNVMSNACNVRINKQVAKTNHKL